MGHKLCHLMIILLAIYAIDAAGLICPSHPNCVCGGTFAVELNCNIDGQIVKINLLPNTYVSVKCENVSAIDYRLLPKCADFNNTFKSVSFKDCPLPMNSFKDVLTQMGVSKTMALIFQNSKKLYNIDRKHFAGLQDLTKLLLSVNGLTELPSDLFSEMNNLTWLIIQCNNINFSEELFKPLEKLETLEISHNRMTNMSSNLFSHLTFLRKLSLWQSNVTWFSEDFFTGVDVLEELDLSSNGLNELPTSIFKPLRKLKKLTLFSNKFSSLPQNLFSTNNKLETLIILNNDVKMKELPKNLFGNLPDLKQVYIQRSGIENVPYDIFINSPLITNISLAYNDITILPESTFNDQINLLELDLSHNNLKRLESKIFSSLVRLEKLNLCFNSIEEISGETFSSLLSLIYLNMENNYLKTISSYLFINNKQRMSISFAHNRLDFENKELENNAWTVKKISPFAHTYNLHLLNLSHNQFKVAYDDWWSNGHETLDISSNSIQYLRDNARNKIEAGPKIHYTDLLKKPIKEVWVLNNPLECDCSNLEFINYLKRMRTIVEDDTFVHCHIWSKDTCYLGYVIFMIVMSLLTFMCMTILMLYLVYKKRFHLLIKKWIYRLSNREYKIEKHKNVIVKYSDKDEEFVLKEIIPALREQGNLNILTKPVHQPSNSENPSNTSMTKNNETTTTLVIFSPNYLTSAYSHVNIKKIRGEMLKTKNTIYVFTDIGPENSIYAFLKDQRDRRSTILWNDIRFWKILKAVLSGNKRYKRCVGLKAKNHLKFSQPYNGSVLKTKNSFTKLSDWPENNPSHTFIHSQV